MSAPTTKTELLKSQEMELIKSYTALDGSGRIASIYTAQQGTPDGGPCTRVDYYYANGTTTVITKMKESYDTWVSATMDF